MQGKACFPEKPVLSIPIGSIVYEYRHSAIREQREGEWDLGRKAEGKGEGKVICRGVRNAPKQGKKGL